MRLAVGSELVAEGVLFDMDGTLIDSRRGVEALWKAWCEAHGVDFTKVLPQLHGVRLADSVRRFTPDGYDVEHEIKAMYQAELDDTSGVVALAGTRELLAALPSDRWTIVTSADQELARSRLGAAQVPIPDTMVGGDDVQVGKPHPQGFVEGARRLGCAIGNCLVFEDAAAGIAAGQAAGARVVAVATGHEGEIPDDVEWIPDLSALELVEAGADQIRLRVVA